MYSKDQDEYHIDPRVREIERIAEANYLMQKQSEEQYLLRKKLEENVIGRREQSNQLKGNLLALHIQDSQKKYLHETNQSTSQYANESFSKYHSQNLLNTRPVHDETPKPFQESKLRQSLLSDVPLSQSITTMNNNNNNNRSHTITFSHNKRVDHPQPDHLFNANVTESQVERMSFRNKKPKTNNLPQSKLIITSAVQRFEEEEHQRTKNQNQYVASNKFSAFGEGDDLEDSMTPGDFAKLLIQAKFLISRNLLVEAETLLEKVALHIPFHADCLFLLADSKRLLGKYREAEILFEKCIEKNVNYSPLLLKSLSLTHYSCDNFTQALFYIRKYLLYKKQDDEALCLMGRILMGRQEYLEATVCFNNAIEIHPNKLEYFLHRSEANNCMGLIELSQKDYLYFVKNKTHYLDQLYAQVNEQRKNGKVQDSIQTQTLIKQIQKVN